MIEQRVSISIYSFVMMIIIVAAGVEYHDYNCDDVIKYSITITEVLVMMSLSMVFIVIMMIMMMMGTDSSDTSWNSN